MFFFFILVDVFYLVFVSRLIRFLLLLWRSGEEVRDATKAAQHAAFPRERHDFRQRPHSGMHV